MKWKTILLGITVVLFSIQFSGCSVPMTYGEVIEQYGQPEKVVERDDGARVLIYPSRVPMYYDNEYFVIRGDAVVEGGIDFGDMNLHVVSPL